MCKLDLRKVLKETRKSAYNGHTLKQLEEWKVLLEKVECREDKNSLKDAIKILELIIELKKSKQKGGKAKQFFLFVFFISLLFGVYASINSNVQGENRLIVGENVSIFKGDVNITNNSIMDISSLDFDRGHQIAGELFGDDILSISTGLNQTVRAIFGANASFPSITATKEISSCSITFINYRSFRIIITSMFRINTS